MPPIDSSMSIFVISLAVIAVSLFLLLSVMIVIPFTFKHAESSISVISPSIFYRDPLAESWQYAIDYTVYYLPFLGGWLGLCVYFGAILSKSSWSVTWDYFSVYFWPLILAVAFQWFGLFRLNKYKRLNLDSWSKVKFRTLSFLSSLLSLTWFVLLLSWSGGFIEEKFALVSWPLALFIFVVASLIFLLFHAFLDGLFTRPKNTLLGAAILTGLLLWFGSLYYPGVSYLGGYALRFLRLEGGVPVDILLKSSQANAAASNVSACLILATGSEIFVSPRPSNGCAPLQARSLLTLSDKNKPTIQNSVDIYERSNVYKTTFSAERDPVAHNK